MLFWWDTFWKTLLICGLSFPSQVVYKIITSTWPICSLFLLPPFFFFFFKSWTLLKASCAAGCSVLLQVRPLFCAWGRIGKVQVEFNSMLSWSRSTPWMQRKHVGLELFWCFLLAGLEGQHVGSCPLFWGSPWHFQRVSYHRGSWKKESFVELSM